MLIVVRVPDTWSRTGTHLNGLGDIPNKFLRWSTRVLRRLRLQLFPDEESHEIALFANPVFANAAFKVSSLAEFRSFHSRVVERDIPIKFVFNHGVAFASYFDDPDGNMIEVYWPTGDLNWRQPYAEPLDLSQPDEVLLEKITARTFARTVNVHSTRAYMGSLMTLLVKSSETSRRFAPLWSTRPTRGNEPPPHVREREQELYFVLEGTMCFYCEDETLDIGVGEVVFLPQGKAHAFNCTSSVVRTLILVQATGKSAVGLDSYFLAMGEPAGSMVLPESAITYAVDNPEHAIRVGASNGIRNLSQSEAQRALPQYPGFGVPVR